jgi:3-keto-disaccharide hydrolase
MKLAASILSKSRLSNLLLLASLFLLITVSGNCSNEMVLFDGKNLDGWAQTGPGYFELDEEAGCLITRGGMGMLFYYDQRFSDFELTLEFSVNQKNANSGVFVRFPNLPKKERPADAEGRGLSGPWGAVNEGYEFQIQDRSTGSVYSFEDSSEVPLKKVGEWNEMRIRVVGQNYEASVNGKKVVEYEGSRALEGYVGVQNHDPGSTVRFRNIRVTPIERK